MFVQLLVVSVIAMMIKIINKKTCTSEVNKKQIYFTSKSFFLQQKKQKLFKFPKVKFRI